MKSSLLREAFLLLYAAISGLATDEPQNTLMEFGRPATLTCCSNHSASALEWKFQKWNVDGGLFSKVCDSETCVGEYSTDKTRQGCSHLVIDTKSADVAGLYQCIQVDTRHVSGAFLVVYNLTCGANFGRSDLLEGSTIVFRCSITWRGKLPFLVQWIASKVIKNVTFSERTELYNSSLAVVLKRPLMPSYTVKFSFLCEGITDEKIDSHCPHVNWTWPGVSVMYPVSSIRISCPADDCWRKIGDLINCSADGYPTPVCRWENWAGGIVSSSCTLQLSSQESQQYTCIASNVIHGDTKEVSKNVVVKISTTNSGISYGAFIAVVVVGAVVAVIFVVALLAIIIVLLNRQDKWMGRIVEAMGFFAMEDKKGYLRYRSTKRKYESERVPLSSGSSRKGVEISQNRSNEGEEEMTIPVQVQEDR